MVLTTLSAGLAPRTAPPPIPAKAEAGLPPRGMLIAEFDTWQEGYANAVITIYRAGTTDLARVFVDENLSQRSPNPIVLLAQTDALSRNFGRFPQSLYTPDAYILDIDGSAQTGVQRPPLSALAGEDASLATVAGRAGTAARTLRDRASDVLRVLDFGRLTDSPAGNGGVIQSAIIAASARGGGKVILPAATIETAPITVPSNVTLAGEGKDVSTLVFRASSAGITITGEDAGVSDLAVDGAVLIAGSVGIAGKAQRRLRITNVTVRRVDIGIRHQGGRDHEYFNVTVSDCRIGAQLHGDDDFGSTTRGDEFSGLVWTSGRIELCTERGLDLAVRDLPCEHNVFQSIDFMDCAGVSRAVAIYGASWTTFNHCYWLRNSNALWVEDNPDRQLGFHEVIGLNISGGQFLGTETIPTTLTFDGLCQDVELSRLSIAEADVVLAVPNWPIVLRDVTEDALTVSGERVKLARWRSQDRGLTAGTTTTGTATTVWRLALLPNEVVHVTVRATAEQVNGTGFAAWFLSGSFRRGPAQLTYDNQTANFSLGRLLTGETSGASGIICADSDSGTTGTLSLADVSEGFIDNEAITDEAGGRAQVVGALAFQNASQIGGTSTHSAVGSNASSPPSGWAVSFQVLAGEVRIDVTGASGASIRWATQVEVVRI